MSTDHKKLIARLYERARTAEVGQNGTLLTIAAAALEHHLTENANLRDRLEAAERDDDMTTAYMVGREAGIDAMKADLERVQAEAARLREALEWYANEDRESVKDGILENVNQRPASRALGRKE